MQESLEFTKAHGIRFKPPKSKAGRRDITLRIYAHLFRKDDGKAAQAINAILK